ncbi:DUF222 domain-containing protein [Mycobacterium sp. NPDC051804]|uniref:DUF222 domain-containing protein n=1 Tax=Mycobacterium sp. NPDC051804 TaxID=3364295 RepID=UPI0037B282C3
MYVRMVLATPVQVAMTALRSAHESLAACDLEILTHRELLDVLDGLETLSCQLPSQWRRALVRLQAETTPKAMGAKSWKDVLKIRWRISAGEAGRRVSEAEVLGPRRTLAGEPLAPVLAATAAAQAAGRITGEHVDRIRDAMHLVPGFVDAATREEIEADLVRIAEEVGPVELRKAAETMLFLLDQDGPEPDDSERQRKRGLQAGPQHRDGTVEIKGTLTPEAWAVMEPIFAKWAAPGMCNPDDENPCVSGAPSQNQIDTDYRTLAQRQHDALLALGRSALESGELGQHNGLPTSIIIRTTLQDLESRAGVGVTGGGTIVPITDVIRMASHANHWLAVFDKATGQALDLFRARRVASGAQRIMLIARDGGCTKPCCAVGAYGSQAHHALADWADDGNTNVNDMALACGPDNRLVDKNGGWTTTINERGDVEWIPPPDLDTGQARINFYHRPELLLRPPERLTENPERGP